MKSPVGSANGPNVSGFAPPSTSANQAAADATSGTVIPMWSMPISPGTEVTSGELPFSFGDQSGLTLGTW